MSAPFGSRASRRADPGPDRFEAAIVVGFALSLSSTPLVLQLLAERHQLNTQHGRSAFAILLFQDIAVMPMLALLPMMAGRHAEQTLFDSLLGAGKAIYLEATGQARSTSTGSLSIVNRLRRLARRERKSPKGAETAPR